MKMPYKLKFLITVLALSPLIARADQSNIADKCEKKIMIYFQREISKRFKNEKGSCGFEQAFIYKTLFVGDEVSIFEVRTDACGGSAFEETVIGNETCEVLKTNTISSD